MRGSCPRCGFHSGIESFISESEYKSAISAAATLPSDCGTMVLRYIGCFAPEKRGLNANRAARLINELRDLIIDGTTYKREHIKAPSYIWAQAMQATIEAEKIRLPLKDHNYLLTIVQSLLNKRNDANQSERADHRRTHEPSRVRSGGMKPVSEALEESVLPELPSDTASTWLAKAETKLRDDYGLKSGAFMSGMMIQNMARELYANSLK